MSIPSGLLGFASRLCMPSAGLLLVALAGVLVPRRLRLSAHGAMMAAHVVTMLTAEVMQMMYVTRLLPCKDAVPLQIFISLSVACWLQSVCLNLVYRLRNTAIENFAENFIGFFLSMLHSWFSPFIILLVIYGLLEGSSMGNVTYSKTCTFSEGFRIKTDEVDASVYIFISKGILLLVSAVIFSYLAYKIGKNKRGILLCPRDAGNITNIVRRQEQALRYILLALGTYTIETTADIGVWYTKHNQPRIHPEFPNQDLLAVERIFKSFSFCVDFFRCIVLCDIIWCRGPNQVPSQSQPQHRRHSCNSLPGYEEAVMQNTSSPPSYTSLFGSGLGRTSDVLNNLTLSACDNFPFERRNDGSSNNSCIGMDSRIQFCNDRSETQNPGSDVSDVCLSYEGQVNADSSFEDENYVQLKINGILCPKLFVSDEDIDTNDNSVVN